MSWEHVDWMRYDAWRLWELDRQCRQWRAKQQHEAEVAEQALRRQAPTRQAPAASTPVQQSKLRLQNPRQARAT